MTAAAAAMRSKFETEVLAEVARIGVEAFRPDALVKRYMAKGGGKATLYRWAKAVLASGRAEAHVELIAAQATAARAEVNPEPAAGTAGAAADATKAVIVGQHAVMRTGGAGSMALLDKLHDCIRTAEEVLAYSKTAEGKVRNSKLMLQAAETLRRSIETGAKIADRQGIPNVRRTPGAAAEPDRRALGWVMADFDVSAGAGVWWCSRLVGGLPPLRRTAFPWPTPGSGHPVGMSPGIASSIR